MSIADGKTSVSVRDASGDASILHVDDLGEWLEALRAARREAGRARRGRPGNAFRRWSPEADSLLRDGTAAGMTPKELAEELGRSVNAVRLRLEESGEVPVESGGTL